MANRFQKILNFFITPSNTTPSSASSDVTNRMAAGGSINAIKNISNTLIPIQLPRIRQDIGNWRDGLTEAENAWFPYRVILQQMYIDTVNDGHARACVEKRKNLILKKEFALMDDDKNIDEKWTKWLDRKWFIEYLNHVMDAIFYGYSLISLGDIINDEFPMLSTIRRWNISPDRLNVASVTYNPNGVMFLEGEVEPWHIWIKTPSDIGVSNCGYGLLYPISYAAIQIRNNTSYNASYNELFGMPIKVIKSNSSNETERQEMFNDLQKMGAAGGVILKLEDTLELIEAKSGSGYKSYADFETRMQKLISKVALGHSDALEPTVGKGLGGQTANKDGSSLTPAQIALDEIESKDSHFVEGYVNELLHKARNLGISIPTNLHFEFINNDEEEEQQKKRNDMALVISEIAANFAKAGQKIDPKFIFDLTGYMITDGPIPQAVPGKAPIVAPQNNIDEHKKKHLINALKTDDPKFIKFKERMDDKDKPSTLTQEEWDDYKTDLEYKKLTKDYDEEYPNGMTKEEYQEYKEDFEQRIIDKTLEDGPVNYHINCDCEVVNGIWEKGECCDECDSAADDYNSDSEDIEGDSENVE